MTDTQTIEKKINYGAGMLIVNAAGEVVLQLRDDPYPEHYGLWTFPGGGVETGDGSLEETATREVREETGLDIAAETLVHVMTERWPSARRPGAIGEYTLFAAPTHATQADVVCNEGADMRFHSPIAIRDLPIVERIKPYILHFLDSPLYRGNGRESTRTG